MPPEQAPDLDLRPGEALRSTMDRWLQQCPHCGYAAPDIAKAHPGAVAAVQAAPFRALIQDESHPPLARRFLAWAHVLEETDAEQEARVVGALRRAGAWDDAAATAEHLAGSNPPEAVAEVIALEQRLIAAQDIGRHTIASALPPPSRRPHVAHRTQAAGGVGLWAWLKGLFRRR